MLDVEVLIQTTTLPSRFYESHVAAIYKQALPASLTKLGRY